MNRFAHILLVLGSALLMVVLLFLVVGTQTPAHSAGSTIKVPDDYATIQAATNAASDGDTIMVATGTYTENITVTLGITLTGGWDADFTTQSPGDSIIDGQGLGRVISITCATSDTVVTVDGFTIMNGDASGLGAPAIPEPAVALALPGISRTPSATQVLHPRSPSERTAELRDRLTGLAERGLYPGSSPAYQAMLTRLERLTAKAEEARVSADSSHAADMPAGVPDSGGGIYSWNASLHLLNSTVEFNVASRDNSGYGGGIFVGNTPPSGVRIANNHIENNLASSNGIGWGGGLFVYDSPAAIIEDNVLSENLGSDAGSGSSLGGGLMVDFCPDAVVRRNLIERNTANASWNGDVSGGGGMLLNRVDGAIITDNVLRDNQTILHGAGASGGMHLENTYDALVAGNEVTGNWAVMYMVESTWGGGGGISLVNVVSTTLSENQIRENAAIVFGAPTIGYIIGGGIYGSNWRDNPQMTGNEIRENVTCYSGCDNAFGGGGFIVDLMDALVEPTSRTDMEEEEACTCATRSAAESYTITL